ncbi:MAG: methyltransferase domain-containing protein [Pseudomonadota bacterium]
MSTEDRQRWNKRFAEGAYQSRTHPSDLLVQNQQLLQQLKNVPDVQALDIACGLGRNSVFLLDQGFAVTAIDISDVGLSALRNSHRNSSPLTVICHDLDHGLPEIDARFDVIVKIRFLNLTLLPDLLACLKHGGLIFIEVLMQTEDQTTTGPKASRFRIKPGTLREALAGANILHYHEGRVKDPDGKISVVAQAVAQRCE